MKIEIIHTSTIDITKITAENDTYLTNGEAYSTLNGSVFLGINDRPENWWEITELPPEPEE